MLLGNHHVEVVVTDVNMPGSVDGIGLKNRIRQGWPGTKVVITSGLLRLSQQDLDDGVVFIPKPYPFERLFAVLPPVSSG